MNKGLTVLKWVLINQPKKSQMPQNYQPKSKVWDFYEKMIQWASISPWF